MATAGDKGFTEQSPVLGQEDVIDYFVEECVWKTVGIDMIDRPQHTGGRK